MPLSLFGNKFSPKKTPPRRAHSLSNLHLDATQSREEFGPDVGPVKLKLGGSEIQFDNGMWIAGNVDFSILLLPLGKIKRAFGILSSLLKKIEICFMATNACTKCNNIIAPSINIFF